MAGRISGRSTTTTTRASDRAPIGWCTRLPAGFLARLFGSPRRQQGRFSSGRPSLLAPTTARRGFCLAAREAALKVGRHG